MLERIRRIPGETLDLEPYSQDFHANWNQIEDIFWKLERIQTFREPGHQSWETWINQGWEPALEINEEQRPGLVEKYQQDAARGIESRRIRIVEFPISPYLQWELNSQKVRTEAGQSTRVLEAAKLSDLEANGTLPEVNILGTKVLYEILYDHTGTAVGARRIIDPIVIRACRAQMATLWAQAEDFLPFFEREIAPLPPPVPDHV